MDESPCPTGLTITTRHMADGWPIRCFRYPAPDGRRRGSILFLTGLSDFLEKYLESYRQWQAAGWDISGFDWRGQGGSGRFLADPHIAHMPDFAVPANDLAELVAGWMAATPPPHVIIAHSMGGHILLRYLTMHVPEGQRAPDAVVLIAPLVDMPVPWPLRGVAHRLARWQCARGRAAVAAWQTGNIADADGIARQRLLTHDGARYRDEQAWLARNPALRLGRPSWRWIEAAFRSCHDVLAPGLLERVTIPVLLCRAGADRLVSRAAIAVAARRMPAARLVDFPGARHELLRESDVHRDAVNREIDAFLEDVAPATA